MTNSFIGDPIAVDWELDYKADTVYFGVVGDTNSTSGRVMRMGINGKAEPADWTGPSTLINTAQPVVASVTPGLDTKDQKWIFFGTGRLLGSADQLSTATQSIYGVQEDGVTVLKSELVNVTNAQVQPDGDLTTAVDGNTTLAELEAEIETTKKGWYLDLPPIQQAVSGITPATRVITASALSGDILFTAAYQPGLDLCTGEGFSRLYGLYYKTGTAYHNPSVFGTDIDTFGVEYALPFVELGHGFATAPSLHTGEGTGDDEVSVFTQLSTGAIIRTEAKTVSKIRSGLRSWSEAQ